MENGDPGSRAPGAVARTAAISLALLIFQVTPARTAGEPEEGLIQPEVRAQTVDYAEVRSAFRTHLIRKGPAPRQLPMPAPPDGVEAVDFPSGALSLRAWINRPASAGDEKRPAVLFLHGGYAFGVEDWELTKPYRDSGYVVMTPILRGENGQEGVFTMFYDEIDDVIAAGRYLAAQPGVDPSQVFLAGHSVGGTLARLRRLDVEAIRIEESHESAVPESMRRSMQLFDAAVK